eukprot:8107120-Lingulodinium_polyedra.AAC.2
MLGVGLMMRAPAVYIYAPRRLVPARITGRSAPLCPCADNGAVCVGMQSLGQAAKNAHSTAQLGGRFEA